MFATVTGASPAGTVTFKDGTTTLGTGTVASGAATLSYTFATPGSHSLTAEYGGDANNETSTSTALNQTVDATVPGAPTIGNATGGNASATVSFTAPVSNGGLAITGYTVTSNPGGITASGAASPSVVTGLTNGTTYSFTVTATNAIGESAPSAPSNSIIAMVMPQLRPHRSSRHSTGHHGYGRKHRLAMG